MKYDIKQYLAVPRQINPDWVKKYVGDDTPLGTTLMIGVLGGGALAVILAIAAIFGISWKWAAIFGIIALVSYIVNEFTSKSGIAKRTLEISNMPITYAGLVTYWSRIFQKGTDEDHGLAIVVYSTDPVLMHDEKYILEVRDNLVQLLYKERYETLTAEEKKIYYDIKDDDKGRYKVKDGTPVPSTRGSKGNTFISSLHFNQKEFPNAFNPEEDLIGYFLENNTPYRPLFTEAYKLK